MIDADDLIELVRNYNPKTDERLLRGAYDYGCDMHDGQFRHSGEPYFSHPVAVAAILTPIFGPLMPVWRAVDVFPVTYQIVATLAMTSAAAVLMLKVPE